jgi:UDP-N-acetylglucosamine 2-epimerase (non-hydrolysing)
MAASIASFYAGAKVCHVEAGLRTNNKKSPFPEEMNRQIAGRVADYHFVPTENSEQNLRKENIKENSIVITGNTVIDALLFSSKRVQNFENSEILELKKIIDTEKKIILITGHRRENHGLGFINICEALKEVALNNKNVQIIYPVHLNPNIKGPVFELLSGIENIKLVSPLSYPAFVWLMKNAYLIITDSGGVQEEAPSLRKPVLVMRDTTERPEAVDSGTVILVGTDKQKIVKETNILLENTEKYSLMSELHNPYGDGKASERIVDFIASL